MAAGKKLVIRYAPIGADRRDRALELPDRELVRRLHPGAGGRQHRDPQAQRGDPAELAADGGDDARVRRARRRLPGRDRRRDDRRRTDLQGRLRDVHGLREDRQEGTARGRVGDDPVLPGARRQGPDDRVRRRGRAARGQRGGVLLDEQRRPGVHLGRARVRRGARVRRVRRRRSPTTSAGCARARPAGSAPSTSARSRSRRSWRSSTATSATPWPRARRSSPAATPGAGPGRFYEPTVLVDVDHSMKIMPEETFGPTLPIMKVADAEEGVRLANDSRYGLQASVWTADVERGEAAGPSDRGRRGVRQRRPDELLGAEPADGRLEEPRGWAPATAPRGSASTPRPSRCS